MYATPFNALDFVDSIEKEGMPREQAKIIAKAIQNTGEANEQNTLKTKTEIEQNLIKAEQGLSTKEDLSKLQLGFKEDLSKLQLGFKEDLNKLDKKVEVIQTELIYIKWALATIAACAITATIKALFFTT